MIRFPTAEVLSLAAAAAMLSCAAPVRAMTSDQAPSITVKYGDLDLGSPAAVRALLRRIQAAADTVCGGAPDVRRLDLWAGFEACRSSAVARAVVAVDVPTLTAMAHRRYSARLATR